MSPDEKDNAPIYTLLDEATTDGESTSVGAEAGCLGYSRITVEALIEEDEEDPITVDGWKLQVSASRSNPVWHDLLPEVTSTENGYFHLPRGVYPVIRAVRGAGSGALTIRLWRGSFTQG